jgi:hypothetical protein
MSGSQMTIKKFAPHACTAAVIGMLLWLLWPVLGTPYVADDIPNSQRSAGLVATRESLIDFTFRLTRQWINNEGRFFPVSVFENAFLFHTVHSRFLYKSLQLTFVMLLACSLAALVQLLTRNWRLALLAIVFFGAALQVRFWYDPTISFGLLLPSTGIKALFALCFVVLGVRSKKTINTVLYLGAAALLWCLALMQYEVVILLSSIAVLIGIHENGATRLKRILGALSLIMPSVFFLLISRLIRSGVVASPAYATNLDLSIVFRTLKYQVLGAIPLSVPYSRIDKRLAVGGSIAHLSLLQILFCIVMIAVVAYIIWGITYPTFRTRFLLLSSGIIFLILPAVPTSLSVRWQSEVGPGHAYLPVMLQYLGASLLLILITVESKNAAAYIFRKKSALASVGVVFIAFLMGMLSVLTICTNRTGIEYTSTSFSGFRVDREIFEAAVRRNLIPDSLADGVLMSATYDPALWVNREYVSWLGGPVLSALGKPQSLISCRAAQDKKCQKKNGALFFLEHSSSGAATAVFSVLQNWWEPPTKAEDLLDLRAISKEREALLCGKAQAQKQDNWWVGECLVDDGAILEKIKTQYAS